MGKKHCNPNDITAAIQQELAIYSKEITQKVKKRSKKVANKAKKNIAKDSPKDTGAYADDWENHKEFENVNGVRYRIRNKKHYQLTHLLENGHAKRNGGRVEGIPHIRPNEEIAILELTEGIKEDIKNSGKGG